MTACCVFSIAAENRFLSHSEVKEKMEKVRTPRLSEYEGDSRAY